MRRRTHRRAERGGAILDLILGLALVLLGAFALYSLGLTFGQVVHGAEHFFGW